MTQARVTLIIVIAALLTLVVAPAAYSFERIPTYTVAELDVGMKGIGKTVIRGTKIEDFNFEILGVLEKGGFNGGSLILVRVWGPVIDSSGGIAGGYSGSPMYVDGKLIGALSAGWSFSKGDVAGVTPIHEMLKTFNYPNSGGFGWDDPIELANESVLQKPLVHRGKNYDKVLLLGTDRGLNDREISDGTMVLTASRTPLVVGGFSNELFPFLKSELEAKMPFFEVMQGPGSGPVPVNLSGPFPEPGAAIGVQLMTGDFDLTAIGTLTYVDEYNRILAFGHPFLQSGYIEMPLVSAEITHTLPSIQRSFKIGEARELIGVIKQDRSTCIAGVLGEEPDLLDITVRVSDEDLDWQNTYHCQIIRHEETLSSYWAMAPLQAISQTLDRAGGGMMEVSFSIDVEGMDEPIEMENVFHGDGYFGQYMAISEVSMIMGALTVQNVYEEVRINSVEIDITIHEGNETLTIIRATSIMPEGMEEDDEGAEEGDDFDDAEDPGLEDGQTLEYKSDVTVLVGGKPGPEFIRRNVPQNGLLNLYRTEFGRKAIRMNAGEEVLEAVEEYVETTEEELEDFYEVPRYYPGDTIEAIVTLRPYRQEPVEQYLELVIPEDYPTGTYDVSISGGSGYYGGYFDPFFFGYSYYGYSSPDTLQDMLDSMIDREPNNRLMMSLSPIYSDDPYEYLKEDQEETEPIQNVIEMDRVVYGYFYLPIEIIDEDYEDDEYFDDEYLDDEELFADFEKELADTVAG